MTRGLKAIACVCLALGSVGCGKDDSKSSDSDNGLAGTWKKGCTKSDDLYEIEAITITGSNFVTTLTEYADGSCTIPVSIITGNGSLSIGAARTTPTGTKDIDMVYTSGSLTPKNADLVTIYNTEKFCGETWIIDKATDITNKKCGDEVPFHGGQKEYKIYKIDGNHLYLEADDNADHITPETRNVVLDTVPFVKS